MAEQVSRKQSPPSSAPPCSEQVAPLTHLVADLPELAGADIERGLGGRPRAEHLQTGKGSFAPPLDASFRENGLLCLS